MATTASPRPLEGEALERTSFASLFNREWNHCYWVLQGRILMIYPNKEAYNRNPTSGRKNLKLKADMWVKDVASKSYKNEGILFKFALEEEIDHGKSVVARFASYNEADAQHFHDAVAAVLKELHEEAGIAEEEEHDVADEEEEAAAPAPARNNKGMWGGLDG